MLLSTAVANCQKLSVTIQEGVVFKGSTFWERLFFLYSQRSFPLLTWRGSNRQEESVAGSGTFFFLTKTDLNYMNSLYYRQSGTNIITESDIIALDAFG